MAAVDASKGALRASLRPFELISYFAFGAQSGALTGVAAKGPVFSVRNAAGIGELVLVRHVGLGFLTTTAFTRADGSANWKEAQIRLALLSRSRALKT